MNYKKSGAFFAAAIAAALVVSPSFAAKKVKWKMHSAWGSSVPHLGTSGVRFAKNIKRRNRYDFRKLSFTIYSIFLNNFYLGNYKYIF